MSQPPAGGFPPPDQPQPGGYPPPAQPGPPGGGYPPPAYNPPPGGYAPPPAPGFAPPPSGPAGYQPPPAGAYPPPAQQYGGPPAPGQGYPPPAAGGGAPSSFDISKVTVVGWGVIGAAFLTFIASFFNFWTVSYAGLGAGGGYNGWSLWWWIPVLLAIAVGAVYSLRLLGVLKPGQIKQEYLFYGAGASFVLMIFVLIHTFAYNGPSGIFAGVTGDSGLSTGPGFGVWLGLIATLALTYFMALAVQAAGGKLPVKVPGPTA